MAPRFAVVGLGLQGSGVARIAAQQGYELVGGVDVGAKVGRPLAEVLDGVGPSTPVVATVEELLAATPDLDFAVLAPAIGADAVIELATPLLSAGVNVLTLHQDLLSPDESWTPALHEIAVAGGASFLSTGTQDPWWIQIPALVASSSVNITKIRVQSTLSLHALSVGLCELVGIGQDPAQFAETSAMMLHAPAVLGGALQEVSRRIGLQAGPISKTYSSVTLDSGYHWVAGDREIPAGSAVGTEEVATFETDRGITFEGVFRVEAIPVSEAADELHIEGEPSLHLRYSPFPGEAITNVALVARIPDVLTAEPGVLFAADLPPARPHFPLT